MALHKTTQPPVQMECICLTLVANVAKAERNKKRSVEKVNTKLPHQKCSPSSDRGRHSAAAIAHPSCRRPLRFRKLICRQRQHPTRGRARLKAQQQESTLPEKKERSVALRMLLDGSNQRPESLDPSPAPASRNMKLSFVNPPSFRLCRWSGWQGNVVFAEIFNISSTRGCFLWCESVKHFITSST